MTDVAPAGTAIRCRQCDSKLAELVEPITRGAVLESSKVMLLSGAKASEGGPVLCPVDHAHSGAYALVGGERWPIG